MKVNPQDIASDETDDNVSDFEEFGDDAEIAEVEPFRSLQLLSDPGEEEASDVHPMSSGDDIRIEPGGLNGGGEPVSMPRGAGSPRKSIAELHKGPNWEKSTPRDATSKPPSLDEWVGFFGKVVLRTTCHWYLSYAFKEVDENVLSDREIDRLALTDDERKLIATPLAELAHKSKFMRKYGRTIVSGGDTFNAMVVMGAWVSRVNRIASKYKPRNPRVRVNPNGSNGQSTQAGAPTFTEGTTGGRIHNGYPVYPGSG